MAKTLSKLSAMARRSGRRSWVVFWAWDLGRSHVEAPAAHQKNLGSATVIDAYMLGEFTCRDSVDVEVLAEWQEVVFSEGQKLLDGALVVEYLHKAEIASLVQKGRARYDSKHPLRVKH
ncbi:hypothetical protein HX870_14880 [Pseudomonas gingeri]|uniref:hypothetical protein n=1 Tax=Pseudomonas gingeri TaxID=117681 RepID=UPI0015A36452|nr:hypothetical protein [Pseudomonas gingeri]NWD68884.1 hypothetical protein [Pseudomonas gingeri]